ncbi:hypothetical protein LPJ61_004384 [Coemansia biformis]|uniref:Uncharacterized protein n=1 Tax=Coemansia biformis TaxID=1286918 RepID=A0A9W7YBZ5_9FUNG|nr:hypothetical protein LPJ61_004384 [Coemansia biformis]
MKLAAIAVAAIPVVALADVDGIISAIGGAVNQVTSKAVDGFNQATAAVQSVASRVESDFNAGNNPNGSEVGEHTSGAARATGCTATAALAAAVVFAQLV